MKYSKIEIPLSEKEVMVKPENNIFEYTPRTFFDPGYKKIIKIKEVVEETHIEFSLFSRQVSWVTEEFVDGQLVETNIELGPLTFRDYSKP